MSVLTASDEAQSSFSILRRRAGCADAYVWGKMWPSGEGRGGEGGGGGGPCGGGQWSPVLNSVRVGGP